MEITPPTIPDDHPDRLISCQEAMEAATLGLIDTAIAAGWSRVEALAAISELADNLMLAHQSMGDTDAIVAMIKRMK